MDSNGNIPFGKESGTFKLEIPNLTVNIQTHQSQTDSLKVDPKSSRDKLLSLADNHLLQRLNYYIDESVLYTQSFNKYGFGFSVDANNVISVVYAFGGEKRRPVNKALKDAFIIPVGSKIRKKHLKNNLLIYFFINIAERYNAKQVYDLLRENNKKLIDTIDLEKLKTAIPVQGISSKLTQLALEEVDRSVAAGKFVEPEWRGFRNTKTVLIGLNLYGKSTVKDLFLSNQSNYKFSCN
jgi:hypothetical protein